VAWVGRDVMDRYIDPLDTYLHAAAGMHANGDSVDDTIATLAQMEGDQPQSVHFDWNSVSVLSQEGRVSRIDATPAGLNLSRVAAIRSAIESKRLTGDELRTEILRAQAIPPSSLLLFTLANATAAIALALIFGIRHWPAGVEIIIAAALGAVARRLLGRVGVGPIGQVFVAALIGGLLGAVAIKLGLSSELRLVVVCPCMVLVPGGPILNGTLDLLALRVPLGLARLAFAGLIVVAISAGLIIGLAVQGQNLPATVPGRDIPAWLDVVAAGVAAPCFLVFFSAPLRMAGWSLAAGALAHGIRWVALTVFHLPVFLGAGLACLVVGILLVPLSEWRRLPFIAVGFAAIVALAPGVYLFRTASALTALALQPSMPQPLITAAAEDGMTALLIILAMTAGLVLPLRAYAALSRHHQRTRVSLVAK
jgi:uncharacterized membrane protein YjjB (DUF3815 family)